MKEDKNNKFFITFSRKKNCRGRAPIDTVMWTSYESCVTCELREVMCEQYLKRGFKEKWKEEETDNLVTQSHM